MKAFRIMSFAEYEALISAKSRICPTFAQNHFCAKNTFGSKLSSEKHFWFFQNIEDFWKIQYAVWGDICVEFEIPENSVVAFGKGYYGSSLFVEEYQYNTPELITNYILPEWVVNVVEEPEEPNAYYSEDYDPADYEEEEEEENYVF